MKHLFYLSLSTLLLYSCTTNSKVEPDQPERADENWNIPIRQYDSCCWEDESTITPIFVDNTVVFSKDLRNSFSHDLYSVDLSSGQVTNQKSTQYEIKHGEFALDNNDRLTFLKYNRLITYDLRTLEKIQEQHCGCEDNQFILAHGDHIYVTHHGRYNVHGNEYLILLKKKSMVTGIETVLARIDTDGPYQNKVSSISPSGQLISLLVNKEENTKAILAMTPLDGSSPPHLTELVIPEFYTGYHTGQKGIIRMIDENTLLYTARNEMVILDTKSLLTIATLPADDGSWLMSEKDNILIYTNNRTWKAINMENLNQIWSLSAGGDHGVIDNGKFYSGGSTLKVLNLYTGELLKTFSQDVVNTCYAKVWCAPIPLGKKPYLVPDKVPFKRFNVRNDELISVRRTEIVSMDVRLD